MGLVVQPPLVIGLAELIECFVGILGAGVVTQQCLQQLDASFDTGVVYFIFIRSRGVTVRILAAGFAQFEFELCQSVQCIDTGLVIF